MNAKCQTRGLSLRYTGKPWSRSDRYEQQICRRRPQILARCSWASAVGPRPSASWREFCRSWIWKPNQLLARSLNKAGRSSQRPRGIPSKQRDEIDFDTDVAGQAPDLDGRARRRMRDKVARVDFIHRGEIVHVGEEHRRLYDA